MTKYNLVSFNLCPFVQRSVITLEEKGVEYDIEYIDLADKPEWFLKISPLGKVPLLKVKDTVLFESAVINEYIDETTEGSMHPEDSLKRAHHRGWIEFASTLAGDGYVFHTATDEPKALGARSRIIDKLAKLEEKIVGPYFAGDDFKLVDAAFAPVLQRLWWTEETDPKVAVFGDFPKVQAWTRAMLERDSVKRSLLPEMDALYVEYLKGKGSPTRDAPPSWVGTLL